MSTEKDDYLELFIQELEEQLQELRNSIEQFEKINHDSNPYEVFFRVTHTLKGNAGFMGFEDLAEVSRIVCEVYRGLTPEEAKEINVDPFSKRFYVLLSAYKGIIEKKHSTSALVPDSIISEAQKLLNKREQIKHKQE